MKTSSIRFVVSFAVLTAFSLCFTVTVFRAVAGETSAPRAEAGTQATALSKG